MKKQRTLFLMKAVILTAMVFLQGHSSDVLGQNAKIEVASITSYTNRVVTIKPYGFNAPTLFVGTKEGDVVAFNLQEKKFLNGLTRKKYNIQSKTKDLIRDIVFTENSTGYLVRNDGVYSLRENTMLFKQSLNVSNYGVKNAFPVLWSISIFDDNKSACVAGVYYQDGTNTIEKELLLCTDNIDKANWYSPKTPLENGVTQYIQLTDVYFDNSSKGWVVGTDGRKGIIWSSNDKGKSWENEQSTSLTEALLSIHGTSNSIFAVGLDGLVVKKSLDKGLNRVRKVSPKNKGQFTKGDEVEIDVEKVSGIAGIDLKVFGVVEEVDNKKIRINVLDISSSELPFKRLETFFENIFFDQKYVKERKSKGDSNNVSSTDWEPVEVGTKNRLNKIKFTKDGKYGFIVGEDGTILYSADYGEQWKPLRNKKLDEITLYSIAFDESKKHCYIAGSEGLIVKIEYES